MLMANKYEKLSQKSETKAPKAVSSKSKELVPISKITPADRTSVEKLVEQKLSTLAVSLTPEMEEIALDVAKGRDINEIYMAHRIDSIMFSQLMSNPAFVAKVKDLTYTSTFASKDVSLRLNNSLIGLFSDVLFRRREELDAIPIEKLAELLRKQQELQLKSNTNQTTEIKVDVNMLINENVRKERNITPDGKVKSKYPVIENGKVVGEYEELYGYREEEE
jgi:hypothetical protein